MNEEEKRIEEAKDCNGCLDWHKYCAAECCDKLAIKLDPSILGEVGDFITIKMGRLSKDMVWYYRLRGVKFFNGLLRFETKYCEPRGNEIVYKRKCDFLKDDLKCSGHPNNKPTICKFLNIKTKNDKKIILTKNCLFRYKKEESDSNE